MLAENVAVIRSFATGNTVRKQRCAGKNLDTPPSWPPVPRGCDACVARRAVPFG
jgi:hypothetical protein